VPRPKRFTEDSEILRGEDWAVDRIDGWKSDTSAWRSTDTVVEDGSVQNRGEGLVDPSD
jgi:hypothetical protein